jgi:hypothetical protein
MEKRLREFVVNYTPNAVTQVTGVTVSMHSTQKSPLLDYSEKSDTPHIKTVTSVTPVTKHSLPNSNYPEPPEEENLQ